MKITLNDIAKQAGVSPSTVQRALNDLRGVGAKKRGLIKELAEQMGYKPNLSASSLKTGTKKIAVVLPEPVHNNRYYARYLWEGALQCSRSYRDFNLDILEFSYVRTPENHAARLQEVWEQHYDKLDGLLTMGTPEPVVAGIFQKMRDKNLPLVFVGTDSGLNDRLCCVRTYDEMAGRMAADLLLNFSQPKKYSKVVITGDFSIADQFYNAQGFERHVIENASPLEIIKLANDPDLNVVREGIRKVVASGLDICAVYATSARNTPPMCQAVAESGNRQVRCIGSDIFPESIDLLKNGRLNAIIHKRPSVQAHQAMQILIDFIVKKEAPQTGLILIDSVIVMKSNLERFV